MLVWAMATARADQCAWISEANARAALEHLRPGAEWLSFCEPCGDKEPVLGVVHAATSAQVDGGGAREVSVDGSPIDLAYTYVHTPNDPGGFTNLAKLVGCPASGVTRRVTFPLAGDPADRLTPWFGTYDHALTRLKISRYFDHPNGLAVQLDFPTEHPSMAATLVLESYADVDQDPVRFATPFPGCSVKLARSADGVILTPSEGCGALLSPMSGSYRRIGP